MSQITKAGTGLCVNQSFDVKCQEGDCVKRKKVCGIEEECLAIDPPFGRELPCSCYKTCEPCGGVKTEPCEEYKCGEIEERGEYYRSQSSRLGVENLFGTPRLVAQLDLTDPKVQKAIGAGMRATKTAVDIATEVASNPEKVKEAVKEGVKEAVKVSPVGDDGPTGFINRAVKEMTIRIVGEEKEKK